MVLIEPGLLRVFRYFTTTAMAYFAGVVIFGQVQSFFHLSDEELAIQFYLNLWVYAILLAYLSISWFRVRLGRFYLPLAIIFSTAGPIFSNLIYLVSDATTDLTSLITRSWLLFPILLVPLVITSWQYPFRYTILFTFSVVVVELAVLLPFVEGVNLGTLPILGVPVIQGFTFGLVGNIINQIVEEQRAQKRKVIDANLRLNEQAEMLEQMATVRERNRLARELHDTLAHTLSGLSVHLEGIKISLDADQTEIQEMLDHALNNTREGLEETRRTLKALRPKSLDELGLRLSMIQLAEEAAKRGNFELDISQMLDFPPITNVKEQSIYRITQEAFQNIIRHANASQVQFSARIENGHFQIVIRDNGEGFKLDSIRSSEEFGINGMKERAEISGGHLNISGGPGIGTHLTLTYEVENG
ncbi:MAG: sensor histidine kinase [Anaerolineales bacterium]|nr:sensor histidine kinase [Anaerolineales bacterium]